MSELNKTEQLALIKLTQDECFDNGVDSNLWVDGVINKTLASLGKPAAVKALLTSLIKKGMLLCNGGTTEDDNGVITFTDKGKKWMIDNVGMIPMGVKLLQIGKSEKTNSGNGKKTTKQKASRKKSKQEKAPKQKQEPAYLDVDKVVEIPKGAEGVKTYMKTFTGMLVPAEFTAYLVDGIYVVPDNSGRQLYFDATTLKQLSSPDKLVNPRYQNYLELVK